MSNTTDQKPIEDDFDLVDYNYYIESTIYCELCGDSIDPEEEDLKEHHEKCKTKWITERRTEIEFEALEMSRENSKLNHFYKNRLISFVEQHTPENIAKEYRILVEENRIPTKTDLESH